MSEPLCYLPSFSPWAESLFFTSCSWTDLKKSWPMNRDASTSTSFRSTCKCGGSIFFRFRNANPINAPATITAMTAKNQRLVNEFCGGGGGVGGGVTEREVEA